MTKDDDISPISLAADEIGEGKVVIYDENQWKEEQERLEKSKEQEDENDETEESDENSQENE